MVLLIASIIGTIAFTISGVMIAMKHKLDLFGVILIGATTSVGGGVFRDILLQQSPKLFSNQTYLLISILTSILLFVMIRFYKGNLFKKHYFYAWLNFFDAIGLGTFVVAGTYECQRLGLTQKGFLMVVIATITAVGGGILRDLLIRRIPVVLYEDIYAVAAMIGATIYYFLMMHQIDINISSIITILVVFIIRILTFQYKWHLPNIK